MLEPFDSRGAALRLRQSREVLAAHRREAGVRELAQEAARAVADDLIARVPLSDQRGPRLGVALAGVCVARLGSRMRTAIVPNAWPHARVRLAADGVADLVDEIVLS